MLKHKSGFKRKIGLPYYSFYTRHFKEFLSLLGLDVVEPIPITEQTIKLGVNNSPEMMCFPYKVVLGNFLQLIKKGANTLVMFNSCGKCKLRHYYKLIDLKLRELNYNFEMVPIRPVDFIPLPLGPFMNKLVYLSGKRKWEIAKIIKKKWQELKEEENKRYLAKEFGKINIAVTGEIYSVLEENINQNIVGQLEGLGATVHSTLNLRALIIPRTFHSKERKLLREKALSFLDQSDPGGHGLHSIEDVLYWSQRGIDGIVHILPLSCHPEILVEEIIDYLCRKNEVPLLRLRIDETSSPLNIGTRVETFFELIKRKKEI
jgi:predicted nucleotide-binding protein (sugar kinase/HSP70/actin superfamily)